MTSTTDVLCALHVLCADQIRAGKVDLFISDNAVPDVSHTGDYSVLILSSPKDKQFRRFGKAGVTPLHLPPLLPLEQQAMFQTLWPLVSMCHLNFEYG